MVTNNVQVIKHNCGESKDLEEGIEVCDKKRKLMSSASPAPDSVIRVVHLTTKLLDLTMESPPAGHGISLEKSFVTNDPRTKYCTEHSVKLHPAQKEIMEKTMNSDFAARMMGAPEVLQHCSNLIRLIKGKRCLDVGTFTGVSALAWALATPSEGQVITMDLTDIAYQKIGESIIKEAGVADKIQFKIQPALKTLDELLANGEAETFDFAFIDAQKTEYMEYYEKCFLLIRSGGIIAIDNALWLNQVTKDPETFDSSTAVIDKVNKAIYKDHRVDCSLLSMGDGLMLAFKK